MRKIANFIIDDEPIAKGGMGQIFKGRDEAGNKIAVKEILPEFATDWSIISRIEQEVQFLFKIDHPSIVKLYAAFKDPETDCFFIVMEFVEGINIEQYVTRNGAIPYEKAVDFMLKILDAMQCVHNAHIIHRDLKPSNVMIREDGSVCLLDFGVAKDMSTNKGMTVVGSVIGTNGYMSPEQADGLAIDYRSDIYSLGCLMYFMLTGHHAFNTLASQHETEEAIINGEFPRLSKYKKDLPPELQTILDKATAKKMTERYPKCYDFMSDLRNGTHISSTGKVALKITVGRDKCDIIMADSERKISRHHADIELKEQTGGQYFVLTDCSSNGTLVDNRMLKGMSVNIKASEPYPEVLLAGVPEGRIDWQRIVAEIEKKRGSVGGSDEENAGEDVKADSPVVSAPNKGKEEPVVEVQEDAGGSATWWLVFAFIFAILGGWFGAAFGIGVAVSKRRNPDGSYTLRYKKSHRICGAVAAVVSIISMIIWYTAV